MRTIQFMHCSLPVGECARKLLGGAVLLLIFSTPRVAFGDCCECTTPFGNTHMLCAPTGTINCGDVSSGNFDCSAGTAPVVVGGTCIGGTGTGAPAGIDAVCATPTPTSTPTPTVTPTPRNLKDGAPCNNSQQCASGLCNGGVCAERKPTPAVSSGIGLFVAAGLLLAGLWSIRRLARRY